MQVANGRCRARAAGKRASPRPRRRCGGARPRPRAHRAQAQDVYWQPRSHVARSLRQNTRPFARLEATKIRRGSKQLENDLYVIPRLGVNARSAGGATLCMAPSVADLTFLPALPRVIRRNVKSKATLESHS